MSRRIFIHAAHRGTIYVFILSACLMAAIFANAQSATPVPESRTYADAMAAANKWLAENNQYRAEPFFARAIELAKTDTEKIEAMIARAGALRWMMNDTPVYTSKSPYSKTRTMRMEDAYAIYEEVLKMDGLPAARAAEVRLLATDMLRACSSDTMCPPALEQKIKAEAKTDLIAFSRGEYKKLIDDPQTPPDVRIGAYIGRSKTNDTAIMFGSIKKDNVVAAFNDLKAATEVAQGKDENKAKAFVEIVELATKINDANTVAAAYDAVTKLPAATPEQKVTAYKGLVLLMLANNMIKATRERLQEANKLAGLSAEQRAVLSRLTALTLMVDADPSDPSAVAKQKKQAIAELDKTVAGKLADVDKFKIYIATGEFMQNFPAAYTLGVDQLEKALKLKTIDEKLKAEAQYQIGEIYRTQKKFVEAKAAYEKVTNVNMRFYNYAQQRMKEVDAATVAPKAAGTN